MTNRHNHNLPEDDDLKAKSSHNHHNHSLHGHNHVDHSERTHHDHSYEEHSEHTHHDHSHHHGNFKELFLRSLPIGIIIMVLSPMMGFRLPFQFTFFYSDILVGVLATYLLITGGKPFFEGAISELKEKAPAMMSLVSLGIGVSYVYSMYALVSHYLMDGHAMDFFFEFASLILIMLLGHWIEMKAVGEAADAQKSLAKLIPKDAHVINEHGEVVIKPVSELRIGDQVRVVAGENIPADGVVIEGNTRVNEALLTGESKPVEKQKGDHVIGGSTNGDGVITVEVTETGDQSFIAQVRSLIAQAQSQPSKAENLAHKVASWLFYIALIVALIAFIVWMIVSDLTTATLFTITTLVIACPHALGLAIPLVVARSTSLGASRGLLIKNRESLALATKANVMILDKTGTLTTGEFKVLQVDVLGDDISKDEMIALLAGIESNSSHPIAQSIIHYAQHNKIQPINFTNIENLSGQGIQGDALNHHYQLISLKAYGKPVDVFQPVGATVSVLLRNHQLIGSVALGDEVKSSSYALVKDLKQRGIKVIMATGDNELAAKEVASQLAIDYYANQSPQDKYELVNKLQQQNQTVIMVGDGVNDAPSLTLADVGIAIGAGTQVAIDSADIILTKSDPKDIEAFMELSFKTNRKMKENLLWGAGYNFIAIPLAAGLLAPIGITLSPAVGAILMSLSTLIVAINAILLKID